MKLKKIAKIFIWLCLFASFFSKISFAATDSFVTIVNPVRGSDFWGLKGGNPLEGVKLQKQIIDKENLGATWLLRFDAINSPEISSYFKEFSKRQELGVFLEIMPELAGLANVSYSRNGVFWHDANKIFLSGYKPEDREKIIDAVFKNFKDVFGYYPRSVGAWHVDAYSAEYLKSKYGVAGVLICADQFGTDNYQIWGGWWGVPYYPSKYNILIPAQTSKNKLDVVVFQWAARDPDLGYGGSVNESTFSVQVNDYFAHGLTIDYFKKLLDIYLKNPANKFNQLTVGLENDSDWEKFAEGYAEQIEEIKNRANKGEIEVLTMSDFSDWYRKKFQVSPGHLIADWTMSPGYRLGLMEKGGRKYVKDLRIYNEEWPETNLLTANPWGTLSLNNPYRIDAVRFENSAIKADFEISNKEVIKIFGKQGIPFKQNSFFLLLFYSFTLLLLLWLFGRNLPLVLLIIFGSTTLSLPLIKSGLIYPFGMGFWGPNGHDGIWHIALINQLAKLNISHPSFSGVGIFNYHFGFDLLLALVHRLTTIPIINLYFQLIPPILAILIGVLTYKFVEKWLGSKKSAWWATFFVYFGGSWGWLVTLWRSHTLGGESLFWANQAISTLINPPYAFSLVILLLGLIKLLDYLRTPNLRNLLFCSLFFGFLIQIKVYAGVIVLGSFLVLTIFGLVVKNTESGRWLRLFLGSLIISLLIFLPFNLKASSLLVLSPFWFPHTMLAFQDRFYWPKLESARQVYLITHQWLKWFLAESAALGIFLVGNLGTRIIGFITILGVLKKFRKLKEIDFLFFSSLFFSLILPLLFIQKGNPWNTIQFFYYFQFFMAILAGIVLGKWLEKELNRKKTERWLVNQILIYAKLVLVVGLTIPTTLITLKNDYLSSRPPSRISIEELEALEFLEKEPVGVVLTYPFQNTWRFKFSEPKPLYAYETTAYVSAMSGKQTYLEDEMNLEISQYPWPLRREEENRFFLTNDQSWARDFLVTNKIKYIYLVKGQKMNLGLNDIKGEKIFENGEVVIYKIF